MMRSLSRVPQLCVATLLVLLAPGCLCIWPWQVVVPDDALDSAIRAELREPLGCLAESDFTQLRELQAPGLAIRSLEGLQLAGNLLTLNLSTNEIVSIAQVGALENLSFLDLSHNRITDLGPLTGLSFLNFLNLEGNDDIVSWEPLRVNASNGGFPEGGTVVVSESAVTDPEGNLLPSFEAAKEALEARGVQVLTSTPESGQ